MQKLTEHFTVVIVIAWILLVAWSFWWFQLRWQNSMDEFVRDELFSISQLSVDNDHTGDSPTLFHFYDEACPCTKFNTAHVHDVIRKYVKTGVKFIIVVPNEGRLDAAKNTFPEAEHVVSHSGLKPPASPSALILNAKSNAEYIGPWSPTAVCSSHDEDYVSQVLDELLQDNTFNQTHNLSRGCLCSWPQTFSV